MSAVAVPADIIAGRGLTPCETCGLALTGLFFAYRLDGTYDVQCLICSGAFPSSHQYDQYDDPRVHRRPLRWLGAACTFSRRELDRLTIIGLSHDLTAEGVRMWIRELNAARLGGAHVTI